MISIKIIHLSPERALSLTVLALFLSACSNNASHLPSPFQLPGAIIGSAIENTTYNAKRRKVESYVTQHYLAIRQDVLQGGGKTLEGALDAAKIKGRKRDTVKKDFNKHYNVTFKNSLLVSNHLFNKFVVLYGVKRIDKKINGLTRLEARQIIQDYADNHFESLRIAIEQGQGKELTELVSQLNIHETDKRALFIQQAKELYKTIYLEPVVVNLMVNS